MLHIKSQVHLYKHSIWHDKMRIVNLNVSNKLPETHGYQITSHVIKGSIHLCRHSTRHDTIRIVNYLIWIVSNKPARNPTLADAQIKVHLVWTLRLGWVKDIGWKFIRLTQPELYMLAFFLFLNFFIKFQVRLAWPSSCLSWGRVRPNVAIWITIYGSVILNL